MIDPEDVKALMLDGVPFARHIGVTFTHVAEGRVVARLADREEFRNFFGGPHAGILFSLAETASGAAMLSKFGDQLDRSTPLPSSAEIRYVKMARGDVEAEAVLNAARGEVLAELDAGRRPEFDVDVDIRTADGTVVTQVRVTWTLRPNR